MLVPRVSFIILGVVDNTRKSASDNILHYRQCFFLIISNLLLIISKVKVMVLILDKYIFENWKKSRGRVDKGY